MRIRVIDTIGDLSRDLAGIARQAKPDLARVVRKNAEEGTRLAKGFAREKAGPHGSAYHKRISAEAITPLIWEYGPTGEPKSDFVGVGFRHGINTDLPRSSDIVGPRLANDVQDLPGRWFW